METVEKILQEKEQIKTCICGHKDSDHNNGDNCSWCGCKKFEQEANETDDDSDNEPVILEDNANQL